MTSLPVLAPPPRQRASTRFKEREAFRSGRPYRLLPFRFERRGGDEVLLVNDAGEHVFLSRPDFARFVGHALAPEDERYLDLKGKQFLFDHPSSVAPEMLALKVRTRKAHLAGFTKLHIF